MDALDHERAAIRVGSAQMPRFRSSRPPPGQCFIDSPNGANGWTSMVSSQWGTTTLNLPPQGAEQASAPVGGAAHK